LPRSFIQRHPEALASIMALSGAATVGQLFISHTIKTFGALLFATVMTTRQFISILLSCVLFAHPLSGGQWAGTVMVFGERLAWSPVFGCCLPLPAPAYGSSWRSLRDSLLGADVPASRAAACWRRGYCWSMPRGCRLAASCLAVALC
jgi:hypothetical protein